MYFLKKVFHKCLYEKVMTSFEKVFYIQQPSLGGTLFLILNFLVSNNFSVQTFYFSITNNFNNFRHD